MPTKNDKAVYPLMTSPGIKRDGTALDGNNYTDGLWCRFRNGRPKKIGGFREVINLNSANVTANYPTSPVRGLQMLTTHGIYLATMHGNGITQISADLNGIGGSCYDRTPAGWAAADDKSMSMGVLYNTADTTAVLIAHAAQDLLDITSSTALPIYYGIDNATGVALVTTTKSVSGGACVIGPFVFAYGSNGEIANCSTNNVTDWATAATFANRAFPASTKVVAGLPLRGGSNAPAGIFWSLSELIRVSFTGGTAIWRYDIMSDQSSILGKNTVVEYDGVYYWPGIDRFLMYNGVMKEVPNQLNADFFFDNVNMAYRNKCWGMRVARWGEIWWLFPKGSATECNWALIYNVRENTWYDTPINPDFSGGRSAGFPARELPVTYMAEAVPNTTGGLTSYRVFQHEFGVDKVTGESQTAIRSYFETSDIGFASGGPSGQGTENPNAQTRITRVEPDFVQSGDMTMVVTGSSYANETPTDSESYPVPESADAATVDAREQKRLLRLRFESNVIGGDYMAGKLLMHLEPGDERG